jgi:HlyD family secretion protein
MKKIIIIAAVAVVILVIIVANLTSGKKEIEVQAEKVFRADITEKVTGNGKIYPVVDVDISAKVSGEILAIKAMEGDTVEAGAVLVILDGEQYKAMRDRARSQIQGAQAEVKLATSEWERAKELFTKNLISQAELEMAEAKLERSQSMLQQAQASLIEAEDALNKTVLKAPMRGVIIRKNKDVGEMALGSQFQADLILGLADLSKMEARVDVNENDIINVSLGDTCEVEIDAFQDTTFHGLVSEISHSATMKGTGTIDEVTNYQVKILLIDKLPSFRPGMSATADIQTQTVKQVLNVPIQSLTARERQKLAEKAGGESTPSERQNELTANLPKKLKQKKENDLVEVVFVVENNTAKMREVKVGISDDNYYEVQEGLNEGEEVITGPFKVLSRSLEDGDLVKIKSQEPDQKKKK